MEQLDRRGAPLTWLLADDADFARLALGRPNHDIDIAAEAGEHAQQTLRGEAAKLPCHDEGDLRRGITHDVRCFRLRELLILEDARDFLREDILRDDGFGDRTRAARRVGSGHGSLGEGGRMAC